MGTRPRDEGAQHGRPHPPRTEPGARPHPAGLFEPLEKRIVLSDTYYVWVGVEELPGYAAEYGDPDTVVGASDDGRFLWSQAADGQDLWRGENLTELALG